MHDSVSGGFTPAGLPQQLFTKGTAPAHFHGQRQEVGNAQPLELAMQLEHKLQVAGSKRGDQDQLTLVAHSFQGSLKSSTCDDVKVIGFD